MLTADKIRFYTTVKLSDKRSMTPEGYLLIEDVSLARTGEMIYGPGETPIEPGPDGLVHITRDADEVFRPETMASYNGKSLCSDHPLEDVSPANWASLTHGIIMHPRRGTGSQGGEMIADVLITTASGIAEVNDKNPELSCGYDAEYEETAPGRGRQINIVGNHVALVEAGRCGSRCAIRDRASESATRKDKTMATKKTFAERVLDAFRTKDEAQLTKVLDEETTQTAEGVHVHVHAPGENQVAATDDDAEHEGRIAALEAGHKALSDRMDAFEAKKTADEKSDEEKKKEEEEEKEKAKKTEDARKAQDARKAKDEEVTCECELEEEAPEGTGDKARKAKDSAYLVESFQETVAAAEIIAPGIQIPTFDRALKPTTTYDSICALRRKALQMGNADAETTKLIAESRGGRKTTNDVIGKLTCDSVRSLFHSVGALKRHANRTTTADNGGCGGGLGVTGKIKTLAELNKLNRETYK